MGMVVVDCESKTVRLNLTDPGVSALLVQLSRTNRTERVMKKLRRRTSLYTSTTKSHAGGYRGGQPTGGLQLWMARKQTLRRDNLFTCLGKYYTGI